MWQIQGMARSNSAIHHDLQCIELLCDSCFAFLITPYHFCIHVDSTCASPLSMPVHIYRWKWHIFSIYYCKGHTLHCSSCSISPLKSEQWQCPHSAWTSILSPDYRWAWQRIDLASRVTRGSEFKFGNLDDQCHIHAYDHQGRIHNLCPVFRIVS